MNNQKNKPGPKPIFETDEEKGVLFMRGIPKSKLPELRKLVTDSLYGHITTIKNNQTNENN